MANGVSTGNANHPEFLLKDDYSWTSNTHLNSSHQQIFNFPSNFEFSDVEN